MNQHELKFGLITNDSVLERWSYKTNLTGYYQWAKAFQQDVIFIQENTALNPAYFYHYDLVMVRLCEMNYSFIEHFAAEKNGKTKLILCCDIPVIYWTDHFHDPVQLKQCSLKADLLFATEYTVCRQLSLLSGRPVYEIPHPADINQIEQYKHSEKNDTVAVLYSPENEMNRDINKLFRHTGLEPIFINDLPSVNTPSAEVLDTVVPPDRINIYDHEEDPFCKSIATSKLAVSFAEHPDYGRLLIYAAVLGIPVIGRGTQDSQRRCFSYTATPSTTISSYLSLYNWIKWDKASEKFIQESAYARVQYYSHINLKNRLLQILANETGEQRFDPVHMTQGTQTPGINYYNEIKRIYGPEKPDFKGFAVVSLVKNGTPHLKTFIRHYQNLGADHFFIIDNGSDDQTIEYLKNYDNITIYTTQLPHKLYECEIRRFIIEKNCRGKWCIYADIDEMFDFPFSGQIGMKGLIRYLEEHHYTAMVAYLLDMFSRDEQPETTDFIMEEKLENIYTYYDISAVKKADYFNFSNILCNYNILGNHQIKYYYGGIRNKYFKDKDNKFLLIKHPLMFIDSRIEPVTNPHYCNKASIADITGILKHYKYVPSFKKKVALSVTRDTDYDYFTKKEYETYDRILNKQEKLDFYSRTARQWTDVQQFIKDRYIQVSAQYRKFVRDYRGKTKNF